MGDTDMAPGGDQSNQRTGMTHSLDRLLAIMARLRDPEHGCPWDREQNFSTIAPYTIEEAYEVADAIARHDLDALKDELGDLLFQIVFHARMAEEAGMFAFDDVAAAIADKMERRHPHVFGAAEVASVAAQNEGWEAHKAAERRDQPSPPSARRAAISTRSKPCGSRSSVKNTSRIRSAGESGMRFPVSVKGVLLEDDRVVLLLNERDEWESPGGRLERGENPVACLEREFAEELGAAIVADRVLDSWLYPLLPGKEVLIVTYAVCRVDRGSSGSVGSIGISACLRSASCRVWQCRKATAVRSELARSGALPVSVNAGASMAEPRNVLFSQSSRDVRRLIVFVPYAHLAGLVCRG